LTFLEEHIKPKLGPNVVFADLFAGTGVVGQHFKAFSGRVVANDAETYSFVVNSAMLCCDHSQKLQDLVDTLNGLPGVSGMITRDFAKDRMFFTESNAMKIDGIRTEIEGLKKSGEVDVSEYHYLIACLLVAADKVANTASVYGAYLKQYKTSSKKTLELKAVHTRTDNVGRNNEVHRGDTLDLIQDHAFDVAYIDPPYNHRQYSANYSVLNSIALYDPTLELKGKAGVIADYFKSPFCKKTEVVQSFDRLIEDLDAAHIFVSYNNEGLLTQKEMTAIFEKHGHVTLHTKEYKKFVSQKSKDDEKTVKNIYEFLYEIEKFPPHNL
jgi:adenine-specific DNA-methyltransferase